MIIIDRNLARLAADLDAHGFTTAAECEVALVVDRARRAGLDCPALDVLADPRQPSVARERAYGIVTMDLAKPTPLDVAPAPTLATA